ncbi:uncharacterized protein [Trachinotus anak]|uniref:uncharacterized protein isoform X2 n=1 Tax=Trachinotus anak TaxID=443729 RepID=UPI0039F1B734
MSLKNLESKWKTALTSILEELREAEYNKLLFSLDKIPTGVKSSKAREEMSQIIIQYYGAEKSIAVIKKEMERIPRMDCKVQDPLRPFVDKLKNKRQKMNNCKKVKTEGTSGSGVKKQTAAGKKVKLIGDLGLVVKTQGPTAGKKVKTEGTSGSGVKKQGPAADLQKSSQPVGNQPPGNQSSSSDLGTKAAAGSVAPNPAQCTNQKKRTVDAAGAVKPKKKKTEEPSLSLNPAGSTNVPKAESAPVLNARIKITRTLKSNKTNTHLVAEFNDQPQMFFVTSRHLAEAFGFMLEDDFKERLPLWAEVKIQGNKIREIKRL